MLRIEMLPVAHGDSIIVEYGAEDRPHRILVDGGPHSTYDALRQRILSIPAGERRFELLVVSHVDTDHIDGIIRLLQDEALGAEFGDVWFNGKRHLVPGDQLGGVQGEFLEVLIEDKGLPWNRGFAGRAVVVSPDGPLPSIALAGGGKVTLLSPTADRLRKLDKVWEKTVRAAGFRPGDRDSAREQLARRKQYAVPEDMLGREKDDSAANGSSIALLFEFAEQKILLAADAFAPVLEESLGRLVAERHADDIAVDAFKLAHHGSFSNISPRLLQLAPASRYLVSTNGDKFKHPDRTAIELVLKARRGKGPVLVFNYETETTAPWKAPDDQEQRGYESDYGGTAALAP